MKNSLSKKETSVIELLQKVKVSIKTEMTGKLSVSPITVIRALKKYGYYSSYNYNASYYTLIDIPRFNEYGLWNYGKVGFSKYLTINETIRTLINQSETGYTTSEMNQLLGTNAKNILSRLRKQDRLTKFYLGHQAVYLSIDPDRNAAQKESRKNHSLLQLEQSQKRRWEGGMLPQGIDAMTVIPVLTGIIRKPHISIASLSMSLQAQKVKVTAEEIRNIISFYGLEKKTVR